MKIIFFLIALLSMQSVFGQKTVGYIFEDSVGVQIPLSGALIHWRNNKVGAVFTNKKGYFEINTAKDYKMLVISMVGYKSDSVEVGDADTIRVVLSQDNQTLGEVEVRGSGTVIDRLSTIQTQLITVKELAKAACCNLSESFETNASVSVSYPDAITGSRQLQMLGLSGKYIQTIIENMPGVRGLSLPFGLAYVPGTWIQSIDVGKGTASVVNGYESMAGAINVELKKPDLSEKLYLNGYLNEMGRSELNINAAKKLKKGWSTGIAVHGSLLQTDIDRNGDRFRDLPRSAQLNLLNRWKYSSSRFMAQFGVNYLNDNKLSGEIAAKVQGRNSYVFENKTEKVMAFSKTALLFPETPYRGLGLILNYSNLNANSKFGLNPYSGRQRTFYANLIYQDILGNTNHNYRAGFSFLNDRYAEDLANFESQLVLNRDEIVPGAFLEYTYNRLDKTVVVVGMRVDRHNLFGWNFTPRLHIKQNLSEALVWRLSAGSGFRVPTPIAETYGLLVSSRRILYDEPIKAEKSWNLGSSLNYTFGKNSLILDAYHSFFSSQLIADIDEAGLLKFYNSTDRSFATSLQAELIVIPANRWELKAAYRWLNVKQTMQLESRKSLRDVAFVPKTYALLNAAYALPYNKWKIDYTLQWRGRQRLPDRIDQVFARGFLLMNAQISRNFIDWEYYLGAENLTNFKQKNPIIGSNDPFGNSFDAGQVWGPIVGRMLYAGFRYKLR